MENKHIKKYVSNIFLFIGFVFIMPLAQAKNISEKDFLDVKVHVPQVVYDIRYAGSENFLGRKVMGYKAKKCLLLNSVVQVLKKVQSELAAFSLGLKFFDCYRPQQAVDDFSSWAKDEQATQMKKSYYPNVLKKNLFKKGYIAHRSGHTRGSTFDVTLVDKDLKELDMGSPYDFLDPQSKTENKTLSSEAQKNRLLLRAVMEKHGFKNYSKEWWHFTMQPEINKTRYFNFPVK